MGKIIKSCFLFIVVSLLSCASDLEQSGSKIILENTNVAIKNKYLVLNGDVSVELEDTLIQALRTGIPLEFSSEFEIYKPSFIWSKNIYSKKRHATLQYHGITRRFSVQVNSGNFLYFESLTEALAACLSVRDWISVPVNNLSVKKNNVYARIRLKLNLESLPRPISIVAASDNSWQVSTGWVDVILGDMY